MRATQDGGEPARLKWIEERLEEAGATLLAMPQRGMGPQLRQVRWPETPAEAGSGSVDAGRRLRPAAPSAVEIARMDEAFGWIGLVPHDRVVIRRILHARALVSPLTGKHLYSWRKMGALLGADHKAVQRWHIDGLRLVSAGMRDAGKMS